MGEEESRRFEAQFSQSTTFVLAAWRAEREKHGLRYIQSPRNQRMAASVAAKIDAGEWTRGDVLEAVKNFMADDWAREHGGINALYEEFETWVNKGAAKHDNRLRQTGGTNHVSAKHKQLVERYAGCD